jgi:hypothetical protein
MALPVAIPNPSVPIYYEPGAQHTTRPSPTSGTSEPAAVPEFPAMTPTILEGIQPQNCEHTPFNSIQRSVTPSPVTRVGTPAPLATRHSTPAPLATRHSTPTPPSIRHTTPTPTTRRRSSTPARIRFLSPDPRLPSPDPQPRPRSASVLSQTVDTSGDDDVSDSTSEDQDLADEDQMVAKPPGEPGRPGSGGYNLAQVINWNGKRFAQMRVSRFNSLGCPESPEFIEICLSFD